MSKIVFYHDPCPDGLAAAWCFKQKYGSEVEFKPVKYGDKPYDYEGKEVFVVDFSFSPEDTYQMEKMAKSLTVLDHHITSANKFKSYQCFCHRTSLNFNMENSGAMLAWKFLNNEPAPWFIEHIEDNDLWKFKYDGTKAFAMRISGDPLTFETLDKLNNFTTLEIDNYISEGKAWIEHHNSNVRNMIELAKPITIDGVSGYHVSAPWMLKNDTGAELAKKSGTFGMIWNIDDDKIKISLRSVDYNVEELAKRFGGGGHRSAAAFTLPISEIGSLLNSEIKSNDFVIGEIGLK